MHLLNKSLIALLSFLLLSSQAFASGAWYQGQVRQIALATNQDTFLVYFDGDFLSDCEYDRVWFTQDRLGEFKLKASYSMALSAKATGENFGVVIDKAENGPGGRCYAYGMTAKIGE